MGSNALHVTNDYFRNVTK